MAGEVVRVVRVCGCVVFWNSVVCVYINSIL